MSGKLTIGTKLSVAYGAMLVLVLVLGVVSLKINSNLGAELIQAVTVTAKKQMLAGQILASVAQMTALERGVASSTMLQQADKVKDFEGQYTQAATLARETLKQFSSFDNSEQMRQQLEALDRELTDLATAHQEFVALLERQQMDTALKRFDESVLPRLAKVGTVAQGLVEQTGRRSIRNGNECRQQRGQQQVGHHRSAGTRHQR